MLDQGDLLRVGVLVTALPLAAAAFLARARYRISARRRVDRGASGSRWHHTSGAAAQQPFPGVHAAAVGAGIHYRRSSALPPEGVPASSWTASRREANAASVMRYAHWCAAGSPSVRCPCDSPTRSASAQLLRTFSSSDAVTVLPETVPLSLSRLGGPMELGR